MSTKFDFHVVPRCDGWAVMREHAWRASSLHPTQRDAIDAARFTAARERLDVAIHRPDGRIRAWQ